jgi:hypothetical protein
MYNDNPAPRARLLSLLVAAACCGFAATASAAPTITLTAAYALNGAAVPDALGDSSATLYTTPGGSDFYLSKSDGSGMGYSSIFFHTYGSTGSTTFFGARASGSGADFYANTSSLYSGSYTNASGSAVSLDFSFYVESGEVGLDGTGLGSASAALEIRRNGVAVSRGATTIAQTVSGTTCSESTDLGALGSWASCASSTDSHVYGSGGMFTVNLGSVAAGETITIDYDIVATVSGHGGVSACGGGYGGYGGYPNGYGGYVEGPREPLPTYDCINYNGIARSGDPFGGNAPDNVAAFAFDATAVATDLPEPGSLALLGAAGGGWWLSRRRKQTQAG